MLVENEKVNTQKFLKIFERKLKNFFEKLPVLLSYKLFNDSVKIIIYKNDEQFEIKYFINFEESEKKNIFNIKQMLYDYFPIMIENKIIEYSYTVGEVSDMIARGELSIEDIGIAKKTSKSIIRYRIEKFILDKDNLCVRNLSTNMLDLYRLRMPVTIFLQKINNKELTENEAFDLFKERSILIKKNIEVQY